MERDILASVIEVESEIKRRLASERQKAGEWLEKVKTEIEEETAREEAGLKEDFHKKIEAEKRDAEERAFKILQNAKSRAEKLENLHDEILRGIISKYIIRILPEDIHDSPDVKG
jgi:hypothetical protein